MTLTIRQSLSNLDLSSLQKELEGCVSLKEKIAFLKELKEVQTFLCQYSDIKNFLISGDLSLEEEYIFYLILALNQGNSLFPEGSLGEKKEIKILLKNLLRIEEFYREIGGIIGYQLTCLELLAQKKERKQKGKYHPPKSIDISKETNFSRDKAIAGIKALDQLAEMYPVGGAADRLALTDQDTGVFQIAATLEFCQKVLLERLIEDLQAREFLYYHLFHKQICVPIVLMTSDEKGGTTQIQQLLEEKKWFGRNKEDYFLFFQPLVPAMNRTGQWLVLEPGKILFKPGGHGVIWKLAKETKAFAWLKKKNKTKALVRQINNLVASIDYGLLAFLGIGFSEKKDFGFASCPCADGVNEGVNLVIETKEGCCLTNIEYCDFEHFQINKSDSNLLANTNLLFVDIAKAEQLVSICPIPGMLVNAKKIKYRDGNQVVREEEVLRLETTMQNLADALVEPTKDPSELQASFITSNIRRKTISPIKKEFAFGSSMLQTPEQCYLDLLQNSRDLLVNFCQFQVPLIRDSMSFFENGPSFIFFYHPSLGPLYAIIQQKLRGGRLALGGEVKLEISDLYIENLDVDGSLQITTKAIMGSPNSKGVIEYSERTGKCILKNVRIRNSGINREATRSFWKDEIVHKEKCEIFIEEGGEFFAEDICLRGDLHIRVPRQIKMVAYMLNGELRFSQEKISKPTWNWDYQIVKENQILLRKKETSRK